MLEKISKLDFDIYYITLYLKDVNQYNDRLNRKEKAVFKTSKFLADNSNQQEEVYLEMSDEIKNKYPNIYVHNIVNDDHLGEVKDNSKKIIGF